MAKSGKLDAIALLKADHRRLKRLFEKFESAKGAEPQEGAGPGNLHRAERPRDDRGGDLLSGLQGRSGGGPHERGHTWSTMAPRS